MPGLRGEYNMRKYLYTLHMRIFNRYKKELAHLASLLPYDQMTMEDYRDAFPEKALDPVNRPTFWPHNEEEQIDYVDKDAPPAHH